MIITEEFVNAIGRKVYLKGYLPEIGRKHPAVILSHGYNGCHDDFTRECCFYAENGFAAYALDFCGGSTRSKSSGKSIDMTLFTEKEDLLAVFNHVQSAEHVDKDRLFLFGGSQGGLVTALAAAELGAQVRAMALYYPAMNIPEDWRHNFLTEDQIPGQMDFWGLELGRNFFLSMRSLYPFERISSYPNKVLIIQGDQDTIVQMSVASKAAEQYEDAQLVILPGEGHGFTPAGAITAMEKVLDFMRSNLTCGSENRRHRDRLRGL